MVKASKSLSRCKALKWFTASLLTVLCFDLQTLAPGFDQPGRTWVTEYTRDMWAVVKQRLKATLSSQAHIAITADKWTSSATEAYFGITAHYIDSDWKMQSAALSARMMPEIKTIDNILARFNQVLDEYGIRGLVRAITTDNEANVKGAGVALQGAIGVLSLQYHSCAAHTLQLCVNDALEVSHPRLSMNC
jgi:hypothetical protein